ncbi:MAG: WG repeat-containing protein [Aureispira sp.]
MYVLRLFLLCYAYCVLCSCTAQPTYQPVSLEENTGTPLIIYYPYHNGVQLIELDYATARLEAQKERIKATRESTRLPPEQYFFSNEWSSSSSLAYPSSTFHPLPEISLSVSNAYVLRDKRGGIVAHYNISKEDLSNHEFMLPDEVEQLPAVYHVGRPDHYFFRKPIRAGHFSTPLSSYRYKIVSDQGIGLMDTLGNLLLEPVYKDISFYGAKDHYGKVDLDPMYYLQKDGKTILADKDLKVIVPAKYNKLYPIGGAGVYGIELDSLVGLLDRTGKEIVAPKYKNINPMYKDGFYRVFNGKWGLVDTLGRAVCALKYDAIEGFYNGFAKVHRGYKWGFINTSMQEICHLEYDKVMPFNEEGVAIVKRAGQQGCLNRDGVEVIECKYKWIYNHRPNEIKVQSKEGIFGLFDKKGAIIIPPIYRRIDSYIGEHCIVCKDTTIVSAKNIHHRHITCGLLDRKGAVVIPLAYKMVGLFQNELCAVCQPKAKMGAIKCGFINRKNELVIPYVFHTEMHGLFLDIDRKAHDWRKTKKFATYLEQYKALQN